MAANLSILLLMGHLLVCTSVQAKDCWQSASDRYGIPVRLIQAIAKVESNFNPDAHEKLETSESIGLMQINSYWFELLKTQGIQRNDLWNPCVNLTVGAWILAQEIRRYGYNWKAIGAYNAGAMNNSNDSKKLKLYKSYSEKVYMALQTMKQVVK